ncbi:flagellar hook-associated protein FlgL [Edaphobacter bradus]|uniref:flagellar hook-associated protein FlgL n=1 Tax=Edaphobacter bradus TaxID=2259016 RepID=UPI0021E0636F|nr:flagellar hook-associated protein FlgL [Edaphobacter bradus]
MRADPHYQNLTWAIDRATSNTQSLTSELSSGLRVSSLSDDPLAAAQSSQLSSAISRDDTFVQTASTESSIMQATDSTLAEVVSQLTSAVSLSVSATNGTNNAANLSTLAQQLTAVRDQVLSLANTSYQGTYLFGGSQNATAPFTLDTSTQPATVTYNGDTNLNHIETPSGQRLQTNLPGSSIFGSGSSGVFGAINQIIADLATGASASTLSTDSSALTTALGHVSTQRSVLDSSLSQLQSVSTYTQTQEAQLKVQQSSLVSADAAAVATQLATSETQYQALLSTAGSLQKHNLFDYLQ